MPPTLAAYLAACPHCEVRGDGRVGHGLVSLVRAGTVVWSGPVERLAEAPADCRFAVLPIEQWEQWFPREAP